MTKVVGSRNIKGDAVQGEDRMRSFEQVRAMRELKRKDAGLWQKENGASVQ